jgi:hypothetical protein
MDAKFDQHRLQTSLSADYNKMSGFKEKESKTEN